MTAQSKPLGIFDQPRTAADQIGAVEALAVIVREAAKRKLPPLHWTVGDLGSGLVARVMVYVRTDDKHDYTATCTARREAFGQYVDLLDWLCAQSARVDPHRGSADRYPLTLTVRPDRTDVDGCTRLVAVLEHVTVPLGPKRSKWLLSVSVMADLEPDPEEQA